MVRSGSRRRSRSRSGTEHCEKSAETRCGKARERSETKERERSGTVKNPEDGYGYVGDGEKSGRKGEAENQTNQRDRSGAERNPGHRCVRDGKKSGRTEIQLANTKGPTGAQHPAPKLSKTTNPHMIKSSAKIHQTNIYTKVLLVLNILYFRKARRMNG